MPIPAQTQLEYLMKDMECAMIQIQRAIQEEPPEKFKSDPGKLHAYRLALHGSLNTLAEIVNNHNLRIEKAQQMERLSKRAKR